MNQLIKKENFLHLAYKMCMQMMLTIWGQIRFFFSIFKTIANCVQLVC